MIGVTHRQLVEIGQRIRDKRESMSLTQENAAEIMDISLTHYKNIERGRASMSLTMLMTICYGSHQCPYREKNQGQSDSGFVRGDAGEETEVF